MKYLVLAALLLSVFTANGHTQTTTAVTLPKAPATLGASFDTIAPKIRKCSQELISGHNRFCNASTLTGLASHLLEQHAVHVYVKFDKQPIGGILTVQADLVHAFSGIGETPRAIISKFFSQAVEELTEDQVQEIAKMLISQLGEEYSKGSILNTQTAKKEDGTIEINTLYKMSPHTEGME